jgi:hypothetical protein
VKSRVNLEIVKSVRARYNDRKCVRVPIVIVSQSSSGKGRLLGRAGNLNS